MQGKHTNAFGQVSVYRTVIPDQRAVLAMQLLAVLATAATCAAPAPSGHPEVSTAGGLAPVKDVVARACELADESWKEFIARGWVTELPAPKPEEPFDPAAMAAAEEKPMSPPSTRARAKARQICGEDSGESKTQGASTPKADSKAPAAPATTGETPTAAATDGAATGTASAPADAKTEPGSN